MDMQLAHDIAERADIDLFGPVQARQGTRRQVGFVCQADTVGPVEIADLDKARFLRHQDQPRIAGIVHEQDTAQAETAETGRIGGQPRVRFEYRHLKAFPLNPAGSGDCICPTGGPANR